MQAPLISPAQLYPSGNQRAAFRLIDVRSPKEVARGALPDAACLPLMTDDERHLVGIRYKEAGQEAALTLGHELVGPDLERRTAAWRRVCAEGPVAVACWRGGLRSRLVCGFIDRPDVVRVDGGYKAIRAYLMAELHERVPGLRPLVIAGLTGSGKTALLQRLAGSRPELLALDLEEAAGHRGSAFGQRGEQPSQATFENDLALQVTLSGANCLVLEDESRNIGRCSLPDPLMEAIRHGPLMVVDEPIDRRIRRVHQDYVLDLSGALGIEATLRYLEAALLRLRPRLGSAACEACLRTLETAACSGAWQESEAHVAWIRVLLEQYYDPLYRRSLTKLNRPVLYSGSFEECYAWMTDMRKTETWMTGTAQPSA